MRHALLGLVAALVFGGAVQAQVVTAPAGCVAGVACQAKSLAVGGAAIGTDALAVTGTIMGSSNITAGGTLFAGGNVQSGATSALTTGGRGIWTSPSNGFWQSGLADVATGAIAQTLSAQGNTASTTNGPIWLLRGPGGGSSTSVGGELRLEGGLSSAAAGTGGAVTIYTAPATAGNAPVLAVTINSAGLIFNPTITSDAGLTDASVCEDTTLHGFHAGSGTLGICLGTSSARYKHGIEPLKPGLTDLMKLRPVSYHLNADHGDETKLYYGFTAEAVQPVLPALVGLDADGKPNTADYLGMIPVLIKAVQQEQAEIVALKLRVASLERRVK